MALALATATVVAVGALVILAVASAAHSVEPSATPVGVSIPTVLVALAALVVAGYAVREAHDLARAHERCPAPLTEATP